MSSHLMCTVGLKLKSAKKVTLAQRPAPFIKPKPSIDQPQPKLQP